MLPHALTIIELDELDATSGGLLPGGCVLIWPSEPESDSGWPTKPPGNPEPPTEYVPWW